MIRQLLKEETELMKKTNYQANMRTIFTIRIFQLIAVAIILLVSSTVSALEEDWPRKIFVPEAKIIMYQPQLETFKDDKLTGRSAVSITKTGREKSL